MALTRPASATASARRPRYACVWPLMKTLASLTPAAAPNAIATAMASVSAVTVAVEVASSAMFPAVVVTFAPSMKASTSLPIVLVVSDTAPAPPIRPNAAATTGSVALIVEWSSAVSATPVAASTSVELVIAAFVLVVVVLVACAPPPLKEPMVEIASAPAAVKRGDRRRLEGVERDRARGRLDPGVGVGDRRLDGVVDRVRRRARRRSRSRRRPARSTRRRRPTPCSR